MAISSRTLVILGCGTSVGVPMLGCDCAVCNSSHPRNARTRSSILLRLPGGNLLVDTTPEMRLQLIREKVKLAIVPKNTVEAPGAKKGGE